MLGSWRKGMWFLSILRRRRGIDEDHLQALKEVVEGISNQSELLNRKFEQMLEGQSNQSNAINRKFEQLVEQAQEHITVTRQQFHELIVDLNKQTALLSKKINEMTSGIDNQTDLLNHKFEQLFVSEDNQSELINRKFDGLTSGVDNQTDLLNHKFEHLFVSEDNQSELINRKFDELISEFANQYGSNKLSPTTGSNQHGASSPDEATRRLPPMRDDHTHNTNHPDYDAKTARNYPGTIFNRNSRCANTTFRELLKLAEGDQVNDGSWNDILADNLAEASALAGAPQVFERRAFIERYMADLSRRHRACYVPGWVSLDDAIFLYWLVRRLRPRKIVQCGAGNGLSSSFMMLALAKNGPEGTLNIIDLPRIFDPTHPDWTVEGKVYETCIPEGKTSAWMVPDIYRERIEVWSGHAKDLLPKMVDEIEQIDFFYHGSDHTYRQMMFEFQEISRKLAAGGIIVADDISWNSAIWDFADSFSVPAYNFKSSVGAAFF